MQPNPLTKAFSQECVLAKAVRWEFIREILDVGTSFNYLHLITLHASLECKG